MVLPRTVYLFFLLCTFFGSSVSAQEYEESTLDSLIPLDTIVLTSGRRIVAKVINVTSHGVYYSEPGSDEELSYERRNVYRVTYSSGQTETMTEKAIDNLNDLDWRAIILYENPNDVAGLYSHGMISAESSKSSRNLRAAQRSAETKLQKRASSRKAIAVLIHRRSTSGGFAEVPTYKIEGEAFGTEPLEEGFVDKDELRALKKKEKKNKKRKR